MEEISWEKSFKVFTEKMKKIQDKYGKKRVAYISTGQIPLEEMALLGQIGRGFMGMQGDANTRLCMSSSVVEYKQSFGFDAPPYTLKDLDTSDTARVVDLFLPAILAIKKEGVLINTERRLSALISKKENELTDFEIFLGIGKALGKEKELEKWSTPRKTFELMKKCTKGMPCDITGIEYDMLIEGKGIQWPFKEGDKDLEDERRLFEDGKFYRSNGKMKFMYEDVRENSIKETNAYLYMLNTGRGTVGQWHTQTITREIPIVKKMVSEEAYIEISNILASDLGIINDELIEVDSSNGKKVKLKAKINLQLKREQLFAPMHYQETNKLTEDVFDTYSLEPSYKFVTINIKKIK